MQSLPLFPLNLVLLPYEYLPLHIFEQRYKIMVKESIEKDLPFGIILSEGDGVYSKGCCVKVSEVYREYQNGEYDILVKGVERFKVFKTKLDGDTVIGEIEYIPLEKDINSVLVDKLQNSYLKILLNYGINTDLEVHMEKKISYEFLQSFQMPLSIKKDLISIDSENKRLNFINDIFTDILDKGIKPAENLIPEA